MALANFTLAAVEPATPALSAATPAPLHVDLGDLLYSPGDHQPDSPQQHNEPFTPPTNQRRPKVRKRAGTAYLPPPNQFSRYPQSDIPHNPYNLHTQVYPPQNGRLDMQVENQRVHELNSQFDNTGQYVHDPTGDYDYEQRKINQNAGYNPGYADNPYSPATSPSPSSRTFQNTNQNVNNFNYLNRPTTPVPPRENNEGVKNIGGQTPPDRPRGFTKVETGGSGGKTQLHAVLDYDEPPDYYDDVPGPGRVHDKTRPVSGRSEPFHQEIHARVPDGDLTCTCGHCRERARLHWNHSSQPAVAPLQGPILLRNGSVPVVPLTSYRTVNNGSFYQIPILWTALSVALGYELQGQIIRGVPCVKRNYQLYCPTAGNTYPLEKIETFIDENKALIKRMYGSFNIPGGGRVRRAPGVPDMHDATGDSYFRHVRQAANTNLPDPQAINSTGRVDACESKTEIMTPYWALNSARKLRAIVNTMHFEQAIHQEVCSKKTTVRCTKDCGCEQKYKWHRLLAYDPNDDCAGIFMDWFLFPSCCVCRCNP